MLNNPEYRNTSRGIVESQFSRTFLQGSLRKCFLSWQLPRLFAIQSQLTCARKKGSSPGTVRKKFWILGKMGWDTWPFSSISADTLLPPSFPPLPPAPAHTFFEKAKWMNFFYVSLIFTFLLLLSAFLLSSFLPLKLDPGDPWCQNFISFRQWIPCHLFFWLLEALKESWDYFPENTPLQLGFKYGWVSPSRKCVYNVS